MRTYNHINDCWNALREAKTLEEVENLFREFPRWSGYWSTYNDGNNIIAINEYDDEVLGWQVDRETLDIEVEED